jgi:hypothetical protein
MSVTDWFVIVWWLVLAAVLIPMPYLVYIARQRRDIDLQNAALSYLSQSPGGRYSPRRGTQPAAWQVALVAAIGFLAAGAFALFFMEYWTRLTLLNWQMLVVMIGVGIAALGLSDKAFARALSDKPWMYVLLMRIGCVLAGIALIAYQGIAAVRDIAQPRRVVEGYVDSVNAHRLNEGPSEYVVVIDGKRFYATFEAFEHIQPNRPVRVEIGAGSGVILAAEDDGPQPVERPRRN